MGFYDSKGYWRNDGDGFYDAKGYFRSPGNGFYDSRGYFRRSGEGFYDARGNWVNPGGSFYDSKGYKRSFETVISSVSDEVDGTVAVIGFILFIPIALLWLMMLVLVEWITFHLYAVFIGYIFIDAILCAIITKIKKHQGAKFTLSFVGNYVCVLSFIYITLIYAVPYVSIHGGNFGSLFEFTLVLAFGFGGIAVVQFFNYYHGNAVLEFIIGIIFFVIVIKLLKNSAKEINTIESLAEIYNLKVSALFKVLFGFAV